MAETTQIATSQSFDITPGNIEVEIAKAVKSRQYLDVLFDKLLQEKVDYDRIPGTDRPTLLKPGAEILCKVFHLAQGKADLIEQHEDFDKGIFSYVVGMPLIHIDSGLQIAYGIGSANSYEKKYRYRKDKDSGMQIENADPADQQNTLIKMANKRAFVDAVLKATGASRKFTQDMEDFAGNVEGASTNQINYIKKLFGNASEADMLSEISSIVGHEVKEFKDILRSEASKIIDTKKGGAPSGSGRQSNSSGGASGTAAKVCADCGAKIGDAVYEYSSKHFGRPLCRTCQDKAKAASQDGSDNPDDGMY